MTGYYVTVTDRWNDEVHPGPRVFATIQEAKEEAEHLLIGIYRDAADYIDQARRRLTDRIWATEVPIIERDEYLQCTVEITEEPIP
jgi:hypothetical protein